MVFKKKKYKEFPSEWLKSVAGIVSEQPYHRTAFEYLVAERFQIGLYDASCLIDQAHVNKIPYKVNGFGKSFMFYYTGTMTPEATKRMKQIVRLVALSKMTGTEKHDALLDEIILLLDYHKCETILDPSSKIDLEVRYKPTNETYGFEVENTIQTSDYRRFKSHIEPKLLEIWKRGLLNSRPLKE